MAATGLCQLRHGEIDQARASRRWRVQKRQHKAKRLVGRGGKPVAGKGGRRNRDLETAIGPSQHDARIQRLRPLGIRGGWQAVFAGHEKRPGAGGRRLAGNHIGAVAVQARACIIHAGRKAQALGAAQKQLAAIGPVRLRVRIGIDGLRLRKGFPRAKLDRAEAHGRIQRDEGRPYAAAEGDQKAQCDKEREAKQAEGNL